MARPDPKRRGVRCLPRRSIACRKSVPTHGRGRDLIVRWIGAAAVKRRKSARRATDPVPCRDTVIKLTWAQTLGRDLSQRSSVPNLSADILAIRSRTYTLCA